MSSLWPSHSAIPASDSGMLSFWFVFSAPLVSQRDEAAVNGDALGISFIHHKSEWQQIVKLLKEKQVKFRATARAATRQVLLEALTHSGIKIVHFTGHGNTSASLLLENDDGSSDVYPREHVQALLSSGIGSDLKLLFLSACYSQNIVSATDEGDESGIPHVIAVKRDRLIEERKAEKFAEFFYQQLFGGKSVKVAFDQACTISGCEDFVLLPKSAPHSEVLFPVLRVHGEPFIDTVDCPFVVEMFPTPFCSRQSEICDVISDLVSYDRGHRCVVLYGPPGVGKTAIALKTAHFLRDRNRFPGGIFQLNFGALTDFRDPRLTPTIQALIHLSGGANMLLLLDCCDVDDDVAGLTAAGSGLSSPGGVLLNDVPRSHAPPPLVSISPQLAESRRHLSDLADLLHDLVAKSHVSVLVTMASRYTGRQPARLVEVKPLNNLDSCDLFGRLYHARLQMPVVRRLVGDHEARLSRGAVRDRFSEIKLIRKLAGSPRAIQMAAMTFNLEDDIDEDRLDSIVSQASAPSRLQSARVPVFYGLEKTVPELRVGDTPALVTPVRKSGGGEGGTPFVGTPFPSFLSPMVDPVQQAFMGRLASLLDDIGCDVWLQAGASRTESVVAWSTVCAVFNDKLRSAMGSDVAFRGVSLEEFNAIKSFKLCLDNSTDADPMLTLDLFRKAWQWLGPVFHLLIRIRHAWSITSPKLVFIVNKADVNGLLRTPGEFLLRLSESMPGILAMASLPLERFARTIQHTLLTPLSPTGYEIQLKDITTGRSTSRIFPDIPSLLESMDSVTKLCGGGDTIARVAEVLRSMSLPPINNDAMYAAHLTSRASSDRELVREPPSFNRGESAPVTKRG